MTTELSLSQYTEVPNRLIDTLVKELTPTEFLVLIIIIRKCSFISSTPCVITGAEICKIGNLGRSTVYRSVAALRKRNLISVIRSKTERGDLAPYQYTLNTDGWN